MQHISYIALYSLTQWLRKHCKGGTLTQCFTQQKDEIMLEIENNSQHTVFIRVGCAGFFQYVVPQLTFQRAKSNTMNLFPEIQGLKIIEIGILQNERCIYFEFNPSLKLVLVMYGNKSNVFLLENNLITRKFRKNIKAPTLDFSSIVPASFPIDEEKEFYAKIRQEQEQMNLKLKKAYPFLDNILIKAIIERSVEGKNLYLSYQSVMREALEDTWYIYTQGHNVSFMCIPAQNHSCFLTLGIANALNEFIRKWFATTYYFTLKQNTEEKLEYLENKTAYKITSLRRSIQHTLQEKSYENTANIIMANLHLIPPKANEVELFDFYKNQTTLIKLNPELTPQANAAYYYQKNKQVAEKIKYLEKNLENQLQEKIKIEQIKKRFESCADLKTLKDFLKKNPVFLNENKDEKEIPFRVFHKNGYSIWVGKNAKNNDLLTLQFAQKNDYWLHAKDAAGSHVIVKNSKKQNIPKTVLEFAAGLAAFYSKQRNNTLVSVCFTLRKYVRKNKKMAPGQVALEREKVILVKPFKPDILDDETYINDSL
jgi:predicted ribosome quality control (RQC) complex YloA/Tae2 family protein